MCPAYNFFGPSGHGLDLGTHIGALHIIFMGQVGMVLIWEHINGSCIYFLWESGRGFELGTHIWVLLGMLMGQVGMGLICEHLHGSCVTYL